MEENKGFDYDQTQVFEAGDKIKEQLISEIDLIRDAMIVVNMFLGEPLKAGAKLLQELDTNEKRQK